ncbi:HAD family hydrolase [candidate division WWE3 bacterium]|jgi:Ca2+-transporting ATPase|uniref:HAD family hydrolase n=1 Tax=candidate division WWE3 bacterium TaxID=2053526 RepID=A0A3A4ZB69_UNCKA|nr:MAG: HAD family hydrolase [candidate division WWE3 bacterium]
MNAAQEIKGLTSAQAEQLLKEHGSNKLPESPPPTDIEIFLSQLKSPLVYILIGAGLVTAILKEIPDTIIIAAAVFINTILGFIQERNANHALEALKKMIHPYVKVLRDETVQTIEVEYLVPGDIVYLNQGDKIPADGKLIELNRFFANEAILTGESVPVEKKSGEIAYMGTIVFGGKATLLVEKTGAHTEMGKIASSVGGENQITPLGKQLDLFSKQLSQLVFALLAIVLVIGVITGQEIIEMFKTAVALAVSAIPEGLLVALTVVLAIGMQRILARKGLVRNLVSAETLGGVTTICVDKTGTLTEGIMQVEDIFGDEKKLSEQVILANDKDDPIVLAAWEWGKQSFEDPEDYRKSNPVIDSIPFDSNLRIFTSLNKLNDIGVIFINGAPEVILDRCNIEPELKKEILDKIDQLSKQGKRLLGFARKQASNDKTYLTVEDTHENFEWVGLLGFFDPVRDDVKEAFEKTHQAGIKLIVITGDFANTAEYVLQQMGIEVHEDDIIQGDDLTKLSESELKDKILGNSNVKLFARTRPEQKLKIVGILKANGEVVAMMGDGVNDAPAISKSDIGIVVGEASDVAKESSDLVLLDSRFSTIVAAIEEGRGIFDNIRKIILYLMCDAFEEIILVLSALVLTLPLPITAAQVLWVNILSDGFPHLALTVDPKSKNIMRKPPRPSNEPLVVPWMKKLITIVSVTGGLLALLVFIYVYNTTGDAAFTRSVVFATVGINSLVYVFSIKTLKDSFWEQNPFNNLWLVGAVVVGLILQVAPFMIPFLRDFLKLVPIGNYWLFPIGASLIMFLIIEFVKDVLWKETIRSS